ncbi:oligosaccharyl transferase subunit ost3/OST6 [Tilletia horrida]|uniref:Oligosaccharyl transferase subunit ost3/OST6 n=1 Tax=Tilletia horrida TaxID=155126 RepID=A0AAN6GK96_9BASI|nr:oligosaccharyl transferase subunit ost3/OST6 [Tilletia horrida]KAK0540710.1 oligosaccharyl transferase subunit ost3/OST6 [Tilletia horrida]KAK0540995.1 oligosaccharyl transferase subunit ost3/OST6 [Tilletia horrida]KAK0564894.1 oligosaccharyl transferase subunit ost3/OST6 [Tilletia horrida]
MALSRHARQLSGLALLLAGVLLASLVAVATAAVPQPHKLQTTFSSDSARSAYFLAQAQSVPKNVLELNSETYNVLLAHPRNYSVHVLLTTTDPGIPCQPCKVFQPEYEAAAKAFAKSDARHSHVFAKLEFVNGREVYNRLRLQHAPVLHFHAPTGSDGRGPEAAVYDFQRAGFEAPDLCDSLARSLGIPNPYRKPLPWGLIISSVASVVVLGGTAAVFAPFVLGLFANRTLWVFVSLAIIITMNSGLMWVNIRGAPYMVPTQEGVRMIADGFSNQFGAESHILSGLYALLAVSIIALTIYVPKQGDSTRQRAGVYLWSAIFLGTFSLLISVFRMKNPSYPFRLFL